MLWPLDCVCSTGTAVDNKRYVVNTSRCPLLLTRDLSAFGFGLGGVSRLYFALHQTSRSRGGGKVGISHRGRDFQGVVGSGGNLVSVCTGFHSSVFSTALVGLCERPPLAIEPPHHTCGP